MMQNLSQSNARKNPLWPVIWQGLVRLDFISNGFTWLMELLARITEPMASLSAIYIIIVAGVPALLNVPLYTLALALIIGSPELLVVGAFKIASRELAQGNKKAWWLMASCCTLLILTGLTVSDLFMWHWSPAAVNVLMGFRCLAGIAYTFTRGIVTDHQSSLFTTKQVNLLLEEFTETLKQSIVQGNQQLLAEVNQITQHALADVRAIAQEVNHQRQSLVGMVNQANQVQQNFLANALNELANQNADALEAAVERLERANSSRLEMVSSRLEQVKITLESNPTLPTINGVPPRLRLPSRERREPGMTNRAQGSREPGNDGESVSESEHGGGPNSKINLGREFTVNHFLEYGMLPTLGMIQMAARCSKGLASRARTQAASELQINGGTGE